jgi:hypothetical protein
MASEIAGEQHGGGRGPQVHRGRTEDVPGPGEADRHGLAGIGGEPGTLVAGQLEVGVVFEGDELGEQVLDIRGGVQRQGGGVLRVAALVGVLRLEFLELGRVPHHDLGEFPGAGGAPHRPVEAVAGQRGQVTDVVHVRMGEDDVGDARRVDGELLPVLQPPLLLALEHARVDEDAARSDGHQILRSRDRARSAEEHQGRGECARHALTLARPAPPGNPTSAED